MKTKIKNQKSSKSWFWIPFASTISLIVLLWGMAVVDVRSRKMALGDATPAVSVSTVIGNRTIMHIDVLGMEGDIDLTLVDNFVEYVEEKLQSVKENLQK